MLLALLDLRSGDHVNSTIIDKKTHCTLMAYLAQHSQDPLLEDPRIRAEFVVASLFHDVFGAVSPLHHGTILAAILEPFIVDELLLETLRKHPQLLLNHWHPGAPEHDGIVAGIVELCGPIAVLFRELDIKAFSPDVLSSLAIDYERFVPAPMIIRPGWEFRNELEEVFR